MSCASFHALFGKTQHESSKAISKSKSFFIDHLWQFFFIPGQIDALLIMYLFHHWLNLLSHLVRAFWGPRILIKWLLAGDLWSLWSWVHSNSLTNDSDRGLGHSVNVSDFGSYRFMRINDLNSYWGLWFGLWTALFIISPLC